jgi:hypothetical protein
MQRRGAERYQHGVWPRCACRGNGVEVSTGPLGQGWPCCVCRGNKPGSPATRTCRRCRPLVLPALALHQPCEQGMAA